MAWYRRLDTGLERNCPVEPQGGYIYGEKFYRTPYPINSVVIEPTNEDAHTGDYSLKVGGVSSEVASVRWYDYYSGSSSRYGFWYKPSEIYGSFDETSVFCMYDRGGYERVKVSWNEDGTFYLWTKEQGILGSATGYSAGEWVHVGVSFYPEDVYGWCDLHINGQRVVEFYGYTASGNYYTGRSHYFGCWPADVTRNQGPPVGALYDDIYWERGYSGDRDSGAPPDYRLFDIVPNEDGASTGWASSIPQTSLYEAVNTVQTADDRPNIKAWETDALAVLGMQNVASNGLDAVSIKAWFSSKAYPGVGEVFPGMRTGGVDRFHTGDFGDNAWDLYYVLWTTDAQNNPWTPANVNATQILFKASQL